MSGGRKRCAPIRCSTAHAPRRCRRRNARRCRSRWQTGRIGVRPISWMPSILWLIIRVMMFRRVWVGYISTSDTTDAPSGIDISSRGQWHPPMICPSSNTAMDSPRSKLGRNRSGSWAGQLPCARDSVLIHRLNSSGEMVLSCSIQSNLRRLLKNGQPRHSVYQQVGIQLFPDHTGSADPSRIQRSSRNSGRTTTRSQP